MTHPIPSAHGQAVRRITQVQPDKENLGVVMNGVYQVLEHRRYSPEQGGDRLILGPLWPEKPDKVIMGQWPVADFVYEKSKAPLVPVAPDPMPGYQDTPPSAPAPAQAPAKGTGKRRRRRRGGSTMGPDDVPVPTPFVDPADAEVRAAYNLPTAQDAFAVQVGGNHYKGLPDGYQPVQIGSRCNLDFFQTNVIKYVMRHKHKGGAADLHKAIHYCQLALAEQYPNE